MKKLCLSFLIVFLLVPPPAASQEERAGEAFNFTKIDLDLLEQSDLLDQKLEKDGLVYSDAELNRYLDGVRESLLAPDAVPERVQWRLRVLRDPIANAFALPNGSLYVNSGLLGLLDNEDQLASVLAHEITHVTNRHSYLSNRSYRKKMVAIHVFQAVGAWVPFYGGVAGLTIQVVASIAPAILAATINGYSRELEREADTEALRRISSSQYDPREMAKTFELLQKDFEVELVKIFYTDHPKLQERIAYVRSFTESHAAAAPSADALANRRAAYLSQVQPVARHNCQLDIESGRFRTAIALSQKMADFASNSENLASLADSYSALGPYTPSPTAEELSGQGKSQARKRKSKMTVEEEEQQLLNTGAGEVNWKANQAKAEELYRRALEIDPKNARTHRGLGMLFEKSKKLPEALDEYRRYIELQPSAADRLRILQRIEALNASVKKDSQ